MSIKAFISYAHADQEFARRLSRALNRSGISAWSDDKIPAGGLWEDHLRRAVEDSSVVIALMTPRAVQSAMVMSEVGAALAARKPVISVIPPNHRIPHDLPASLRDTQLVRAGNSTDDEVAAAVLGRLEGLVDSKPLS